MIKSKKFRKINIDGKVFGWMVKEAYDFLFVYIQEYYCDGGRLEVQVKSDIGKFWIDFPHGKLDNLRYIQPKDVRNMILFAVNNGWNPEDKLSVKTYILDGEDFIVKEGDS